MSKPRHGRPIGCIVRNDTGTVVGKYGSVHEARSVLKGLGMEDTCRVEEYIQKPKRRTRKKKVLNGT